MEKANRAAKRARDNLIETLGRLAIQVPSGIGVLEKIARIKTENAEAVYRTLYRVKPDKYRRWNLEIEISS